MEAPLNPCDCHHCHSRVTFNALNIKAPYGNVNFASTMERDQWTVEMLTALSGYLGTEGKWE